MLFNYLLKFFMGLISRAVRLFTHSACMTFYGKTFTFTFTFLYRPMVQDAGGRPITGETRFQSQTGRVGFEIQALTLRRVSFLGVSIFFCQYNSTIAP